MQTLKTFGHLWLYFKQISESEIYKTKNIFQSLKKYSRNYFQSESIKVSTAIWVEL